jgi:acyl-CoA hydrolase
LLGQAHPAAAHTDAVQPRHSLYVTISADYLLAKRIALMKAHDPAAKALIGIAHPDFREGLERQAYEHRLIPRGLSF